MTGINNRLSTKSSSGGIHADNKGVYLNPFVYRDRVDNQIAAIGFHVFHFNWSISDGFNPIRRVIFLTDKNERIAFDVIDHDFDFKINNWNTISKEYNTSFTESGMGHVSFDDFFKLSHAKFVEAKIEGGKLYQTYSVKDISPIFLPNLKRFFETIIVQN